MPAGWPVRRSSTTRSSQRAFYSRKTKTRAARVPASHLFGIDFGRSKMPLRGGCNLGSSERRVFIARDARTLFAWPSRDCPYRCRAYFNRRMKRVLKSRSCGCASAGNTSQVRWADVSKAAKRVERGSLAMEFSGAAHSGIGPDTRGLRLGGSRRTQEKHVGIPPAGRARLRCESSRASGGRSCWNVPSWKN